MSGRTHLPETKQKISDAKKGENAKKGEKNHMFGKNHSPETKQIMSDAKKGEKNPMYGKTGENHPRFGLPKAEGAGKAFQKIEVFDSQENITTSYDSISAAAIVLNIRPSAISLYFARNQSKLFKGRYTFKKVN
jgi:group I intron endonuclease